MQDGSASFHPGIAQIDFLNLNQEQAMYACPGLHLSLFWSFTQIYYLKGVLPIHALTAWAPLLDLLIYEPTKRLCYFSFHYEQ